MLAVTGVVGENPVDTGGKWKKVEKLNGEGQSSIACIIEQHGRKLSRAGSPSTSRVWYKMTISRVKTLLLALSHAMTFI